MTTMDIQCNLKFPMETSVYSVVNIALFRKGEFVIFAMTNGTALIFIGPGITGSSNNISTTTVTTFAGGTLVVNVPGSYSTSYDTGSGGSIDQSSNTASFSGVFSGSGALNFVNTGSGGDIILSGTNTYTGATTVDTGGKLSVNGSIASSSSLTVSSGGTIGGNGILPNTLIVSGGHLAPGNSIGQVTVASLNFGPGGIVDAEIQGPQNDKTTVTGTVTNFNGTANLIA